MEPTKPQPGDIFDRSSRSWSRPTSSDRTYSARNWVFALLNTLNIIQAVD
jgi:hypothetical protein